MSPIDLGYLVLVFSTHFEPLQEWGIGGNRLPFTFVLSWVSAASHL